MGRTGQIRKGYHQRMKDKRIEELQRALQEQSATVEELEDARDVYKTLASRGNVLIDRYMEELAKATIRITAMQAEAQKKEATHVHNLICIGAVGFMVGVVVTAVAFYIGRG